VTKSDWRRVQAWNYLICWIPDVKKSDWLKPRRQKIWIDKSPTSRNLIGWFSDVKKTDWVNLRRQETWLAELRVLRNVIGRELDCENIWLADVPTSRKPIEWLSSLENLGSSSM
jgi:hypothetical protein